MGRPARSTTMLNYLSNAPLVSDLIHFLDRGNGEPLGLLFGDVDDFKRFNTDYGHKAGDAVLRQVFMIAKRVVGDRGEVYRRGGEEIVALLPYCDLEVSQSVAELIRRDVEQSAVN